MQLRFFPGIMYLSKLKSALCYFGGGERVYAPTLRSKLPTSPQTKAYQVAPRRLENELVMSLFGRD